MMYITIIVLSIIITILCIHIFDIIGLLSLLITIPLIIMYINSNKIINIIIKKRRNKDKINLSARKEVDFVSSKEQKKVVKQTKKTTNNKNEKIKQDTNRRNVDNKNNNKKKIAKKKNKNTNRREKNNKPKKKIKILRLLLNTFLSLCIFGVFAIATFMIYIVVTTEEFDPEALKNQDQTIIYDKSGNEIASLGAEKRESIEYKELPQVLIDALIATEDSRFFQHNGVDMARFLKASALQLLGHNDAGGASTLTMQVVKNNLTDTTSSGLAGIIRKFKDVYLSVFFIEKKYSKEEIIQMYVNDSCLGGTIFGVEEASNYYFGKSAAELSLPEAALLAGMYQAPSRYNPYKNPEGAYNRRNTVLTLMVRHGYITEEEKEMANAISIESMLAGNEKEDDYQGYIDTVIEEVINKTGNNPSQVSMKIYTALDREIQNGINSILNGTSYTKWKDDKLQAGIAVVDVNNGTIVAIGAGRNREAGDWNYATQARRQPGSTAKPLFDYGPGFEYNDYSTYTLFNDEKWTYTNGPQVGNWDNKHEGLITLRRALSVSRNIPALKAFQEVDTKNIVNFVNGLGLDVAYSTSSENYKKYDNGADNLINEAYSIGGVSYGFTPLEIAEAYACFANGGYHIESHTVTKIEYRGTGEVIEFTEEKEKVMSDSTAYLMNNVLQYAVEHAFNGGARVYGSTVAAKTGTSNLPSEVIKQYNLPSGTPNDLWTAAYTPEYSIALWYGYEKVDSNHYLGSASAPKDDVMKEIMKYIPKTTTKWTVPSSVVAVTVEKETWPAQLASEYTPNDMKITEYFKKGTQPTEISPRYAKFDPITNLQSTKTENGYKLTWNWKTPEILDSSYLSKYFSKSVYGNESAKYLKQRIDYNTNTLGGNGFGIYIKSNTGSLELLDFTQNNEYTYIPKKSGEVTLVVKAKYKNFDSNASDGKEIVITSNIETNTETQAKLEIILNGGSQLNVIKGNYTEGGLTVKYNNEDVTTLVNGSIKYEFNDVIYSSKEELTKVINELNIGTKAEIKYTVTYKDKIKTTTRFVNITG